MAMNIAFTAYQQGVSKRVFIAYHQTSAQSTLHRAKNYLIRLNALVPPALAK